MTDESCEIARHTGQRQPGSLPEVQAADRRMEFDFGLLLRKQGTGDAFVPALRREKRQHLRELGLGAAEGKRVDYAEDAHYRRIRRQQARVVDTPNRAVRTE